MIRPRWRVLAASGAVAVVLAGCSGGKAASRPTTTTTAAVSYPDPGGEQEYETASYVLQEADGPAMLCTGGLLLSLPPQCGGPTVTNWDWDTAPAADHRNGVRWSSYRVRGTFDGTRFTLTAPPERHDPSADASGPPADRPATPCPEPKGGWVVTDADKVDDEGALISAARAQPDFGGIWLNDLDDRSDDERQDLAKAVFTVTFTGDLARHEAELRTVWGGPLCVALAPRAGSELTATADRITADMTGGKLGDLQVSSVDPDATTGTVHVSVLWAPAGTADQLTGRYGVPVEVFTALKPVR